MRRWVTTSQPSSVMLTSFTGAGEALRADDAAAGDWSLLCKSNQGGDSTTPGDAVQKSAVCFCLSSETRVLQALCCLIWQSCTAVSVTNMCPVKAQVSTLHPGHWGPATCA